MSPRLDLFNQRVIFSGVRYLAIDLGEKRTGLAIGDDETGIATPLEVIDTSDDEQRLSRIAQAIEDHHPDALIVGLPLNMDASEGPASGKIRDWAQKQNQRFGLPIHLVDERLTSHEADSQMNRSGLTRQKKKKRRDALAAAVILRDYLQSYH